MSYEYITLKTKTMKLINKQNGKTYVEGEISTQKHVKNWDAFGNLTWIKVPNYDKFGRLVKQLSFYPESDNLKSITYFFTGDKPVKHINKLFVQV